MRASTIIVKNQPAFKNESKYSEIEFYFDFGYSFGEQVNDFKIPTPPEEKEQKSKKLKWLEKKLKTLNKDSTTSPEKKTRHGLKWVEVEPRIKLHSFMAGFEKFFLGLDSDNRVQAMQVRNYGVQVGNFPQTQSLLRLFETDFLNSYKFDWFLGSRLQPFTEPFFNYYKDCSVQFISGIPVDKDARAYQLLFIPSESTFLIEVLDATIIYETSYKMAKVKFDDKLHSIRLKVRQDYGTTVPLGDFPEIKKYDISKVIIKFTESEFKPGTPISWINEVYGFPDPDEMRYYKKHPFGNGRLSTIPRFIATWPTINLQLVFDLSDDPRFIPPSWDENK